MSDSTHGIPPVVAPIGPTLDQVVDEIKAAEAEARQKARQHKARLLRRIP